MEIFWVAVGSLATLAAVFLGWLQIRSASSKLTATVERNDFVLPEYFDDGPRELWRVATGEMFEGLPTEQKQIAKETLRTTIEAIFPAHAIWEMAGNGSLVIVKVRNGGRTTAEGVEVNVPYGYWAKVVRTGRSALQVKISGSVELGDLRPGEGVDAYIWTDNLAHWSKTEVFQKNGRARVFHRERVSPFWKGLADKWSFILLTIFLLTLGIVSILMEWYTSTAGDSVPGK